MRAIVWVDGEIVVIDQTLLPHREALLTLRTTDELAEAISALRVRGAPALGIIGAMGVAQAAANAGSPDPSVILARAQEAGEVLAGTRPTAVNLAWGIERVLSRARAEVDEVEPGELVELMLEEALLIQAEDESACLAMAKYAIEFFAEGATVLTHCNTGFLCTGGYGTALGAIRYAHESGLGISVLATETRPLLQGARLTAWELGRLEIPHRLVVDAAAPGLIARGRVGLVIVGADRIVANGDTANKVGTYPLALAAKAAEVPFVVVAPTSTIDLDTPNGWEIEVEERASDEVTSFAGTSTAPVGTQALNPAFDVTPGSLISAVVSEQGIARAPYKTSLARLGRRSARG